MLKEMILIPRDAGYFKPRWYKLCKNQKLIQEFIDSGESLSEIANFPHKKAAYCVNSFNGSIERMGYQTIVKAGRKGEIPFLARLETDK